MSKDDKVKIKNKPIKETNKPIEAYYIEENGAKLPHTFKSYTSAMMVLCRLGTKSIKRETKKNGKKLKFWSDCSGLKIVPIYKELINV